jgi:hypothetical protein
LLRLRQLTGFWLNRRTRLELTAPVRVLVVTFNRTLKGYITALAEQQVGGRANLDLTVTTCAKWARELTPSMKQVESDVRAAKLRQLGHSLIADQHFLEDEVDYVLGRFLPADLSQYLSCSRDGRGTSPRVDRSLRQQLLEQVILPYNSWKESGGVCDWNDRVVEVHHSGVAKPYDIIIADEAQDLAANEVRALMRSAADPSSVTFVLDAAQRIYPRGFTWKEAGVSIGSGDSHRLGKNYRNTVETCQFAMHILEGMELGDDGTFPDFKSCTQHGPKPKLLKGLYSDQVAYAIDYLKAHVDLSNESVAFLKPKGGAWFDFLKLTLAKESFKYVTLTREDEWPEGAVNIALSTMSSAKGLEFDHVFILGLNQKVTPHGSEVDDSSLLWLRRLLAMAVTRARKAVILGSKPSEVSTLISFFDPKTFDEVIRVF